MLRSLRTLVALALLVAVPALSAAEPALSAQTPVRIMPLGDSITAGTGCWRAKLWHQLQISGHPAVDFVGGVSDGGGCNPGYPYDFDHEGHGGFSATGIADTDQLPAWLAASRPDVVMMHLGTNDMWGGHIPPATKLAAFTKLIGQMRAANPAMKIIVAQIIPMSAAACATCPADVAALNAAIPGWATGLSTAQSPVVVADLWTGYDAVADNVDGVHPADTGYQKMAAAWYPVLSRVLGGTTPPSSPTTPPTSPPTTPPAGGCTAAYRVISAWSGAFQGEVTIRNDSTARTTTWTALVTFPDAQRITQAWNAVVTQNGSAVTATDAGWNGALTPGGSTTFGFTASGNSNRAPELSCTLR
jgi:lysophospholipase L1-like esterase